MSVIRFPGDIFVAELAPDARTCCRSCGRRIEKGEPRIMYTTAMANVFHWFSRRRGGTMMPRRCGVHIGCLLDDSGGVEFVQNLMALISDERLVAMGFAVDHPAATPDLSTPEGVHAWIDTLSVGDTVYIDPSNSSNERGLDPSQAYTMLRVGPRESRNGRIDRNRVQISHRGGWWVQNSSLRAGPEGSVVDTPSTEGVPIAGVPAESVDLQVGDVLVPRVRSCSHGGTYREGGEYVVNIVRDRHSNGELNLSVRRPGGGTWGAHASDFNFLRRP